MFTDDYTVSDSRSGKTLDISKSPKQQSLTIAHTDYDQGE